MAHGYQMVTWNPFKKGFDLWLLAGVALYLTAFIGVSYAVQPPGESFTPIQALIRATGTLAFLLLTFILCIGPMARLTPRFKPFLYNRRHLGVTTFLIALVHAGLVTLWYHGFSDMNAFVSLLVSNPRYDSIAGFPFESLGLVALIVLFLMAATSHDFWNTNLGPGVWKALHMGVYLAYALLILHVALGVLQAEQHPVYLIALGLAGSVVAVLQLSAGLLASGGGQSAEAPEDGWIDAGSVTGFKDARALILHPKEGERIAVFRQGREVYAISNVCRHQGGPLGEGRIVDGCVTCPWHGFQYRLEDGRAPEPFTERLATYPTRIRESRVEVRATPDAPGTRQTPSLLPEEALA